MFALHARHGQQTYHYTRIESVQKKTAEHEKRIVAMQRHQIKTQAQLVALITSHTSEMLCRVCYKGMGKLVVIPVDAAPEAHIFALCDDCFREVIDKKRQTWFVRLRLLIRDLKRTEKPEE